MTKPYAYTERYARKTEWNGIKMTLIGGWIDLASYYAGDDGNAWVHQSSFCNVGPIEQFKTRVLQGKLRGELLR